MSVGQCIALLKAEVERKLATALIVFSACPRLSPLTCLGIPAGGHGLQPQLQARERAAHTGTVSEQCLEPNRAKFSRQLKRISVQMDSVVRVSRTPASQSVSNAYRLGSRAKCRDMPRVWANTDLNMQRFESRRPSRPVRR